MGIIRYCWCSLAGFTKAFMGDVALELDSRDCSRRMEDKEVDKSGRRLAKRSLRKWEKPNRLM